MAKRNGPLAQQESLSSVIESALSKADNLGSLVRAARAYVNMSQKVLAERAKVSVATINRIESDQPVQQKSVLRVIQALETHGVEFLNERGFCGFRSSRSNVQV